MKRTLLFLVAGFGALGPRGLGQEIFRIHDGAAAADGLGVCVRFVDVDGDAIDDYLLGAPGIDDGAVLAVSAATGAELWRIQGSPQSDGLGAVIADAGDFDRDGVHDVVASAPLAGPGVAEVHSGATRARLARSIGVELDDYYGLTVAGIGDVDGDGLDDVLVGSDANYARVLGGPDGHVLRVHNGPWWGAAGAGLGDVDADGTPDYAIGWKKSSVNGTWTGSVRVYSGATGAVLYAVHGDNPVDGGNFDGDHLGYSVTGVGDIDGDSVPDFVAGAPGGSDILHVSGPGFVRGYSGATGSVLFTHYGAEEDSTLGVTVASGGDFNGDGVQDLLAGGPHETVTISGQGAVYCFSQATGTTLWKQLGLETADRFGRFIGVLSDLDGDGYAEFAMGDPQASFTGFHTGRITIYRGGLGDAVRFCAATSNSTGNPARIAIDGPISVSYARMSLVASDAPASQFALFLYGGTEVANPFGNGTLCAGAPIFRLGPPQILDASGGAVREIDFAAPPVGSGAGAWIPGSTWILQLWFRDPQAGGARFNLSDALRLTPTV